MRVIVLLSSLYTGGAEFSTLSFYGWLAKRGHTVKLICYKRASPTYDPLPFGLDQVLFIEGRSFFKKIRFLNSIIAGFKPQLVHSVLFEANVLARMCRIVNRNFIHLESLVNETYSPFRLSDPNITRFKLEAYRLFDRITQHAGVDHFHANGTSVAMHYQQKLGINPKRITVVQRGRMANPYVGDLENRKKVRNELETGNRILIVNVARHEYQKGQDVLLDAIEKLGHNKDTVQLVLIGREGKLTEVLRRKIKDSKLGSCVTLLGHRSDVSALLAAADVFIFPSRFEGLPGALIEAEAAALPIICSDIPNNREVAENRNALFFPLDDAHSLSVLIMKLADYTELRTKMSAESHSIYESKFSLEGIHTKMLSLVEGLISDAAKD